MHLPSLLCIAHQLRSLRLRCGTMVRTGASPGATSDKFAAGWDCLRHLELDQVCLDAACGAVHLPSLEQLFLLDVTLGVPEDFCKDYFYNKGEAYFCNDAFSAGCPSCTVLHYCQPLPISPADGLLCKDFLKLERLVVAMVPPLPRLWEPYRQMDEYGWPAVPPAVTSLTLQVKDMHRGVLDLRSMLALTAPSTAAGVPLEQLCLHDCVPCEWEYGWGYMEEDDYEEEEEEEEEVYVPAWESVASRYAAVCASLRGLTSMELTRPGCNPRLLHAMVAALPDLRDLSVEVPDEYCGNMPILCSGLEVLELTFSFHHDRRRGRYGCHEALNVSLSDASTLRTSVIHVDEGDIEEGRPVVQVHISGYDAAASITPGVEVVCNGEGAPEGARLNISVGGGRAGHVGQGAACVTFEFEHKVSENPDEANWRALPVHG